MNEQEIRDMLDYHTFHQTVPPLEDGDYIEYDYEDSVVGKCKLKCSVEMVQDMEVYHRRAKLLKGPPITEQEIKQWSDLYDRMFRKGYDAPILTDDITPEEVTGWWQAYMALKEFDFDATVKKYKVRFEPPHIPYVTTWEDAESHEGYDTDWRRSCGLRCDYADFVMGKDDTVWKSDVYYKVKPVCCVCGDKEADLAHVVWSCQTLYRDRWWYIPSEFWLCKKCTVQDAVRKMAT